MPRIIVKLIKTKLIRNSLVFTSEYFCMYFLLIVPNIILLYNQMLYITLVITPTADSKTTKAFV